MALPFLQSFCCAHDIYGLPTFDENLTIHDYILKLPSGVDQDFFVFNILCIASSLVGIIGAAYHLLSRRLTFRRYRHESDLTVKAVVEHNDVIVWLTTADLLADIGILVRSSLWLAKFIPHSTNAENAALKRYLCVAVNEWIQYFFICTYIWTIMFAVNLCIMARNSQNRQSWLWAYHVVSWPLAGVLCACGAIPLYWPSLSECVSSALFLIPNYAITYLILVVVLVALPFIYLRAYCYSYSYRSMDGVRQLQTDELQRMNDLRGTFFSFVLVFYLCWLPNVVVAALLIFPRLPRFVFTVFWELTAVLNPVQALLNGVAFHGVGLRRAETPRTWVMPRSTLDGSSTSGYFADEEERVDDNQVLIFGDE